MSDSLDFARQIDTLQDDLRAFFKQLDTTGIRRAFTDTGRRLRTRVTRGVAGAKKVNQRGIRKLIRFFVRPSKRTGRLTLRLWIGLERGVSFSDLSRSQAKAQAASIPGAFKLGDTGPWVRRVNGKIESARVPLLPEAESVLSAEASLAFRTILPQQLARQISVLARTGFRRSRNRR